MESLYLLIPLSLLILVVIVAILFWALKDGQFDDMEGPAHSILMDDDLDIKSPHQAESKKLDAGQSSSVKHPVASRQSGSAKN